MTRSELQTAIETEVPGFGKVIVVAFTQLGGGRGGAPSHGVVAYVRDDDDEPFVTHYWSIRSDRQQRLILHAGHYDDNAQRWMLDYYERANQGGTTD